MLEQMIEDIISKHKADPRNKVFVGWDVLLQSAREELNKEVSSERLAQAFAAFISRQYSEEDAELYDAAISVLGNVAANCFFEGDYDATYSVSILEQDIGFVAEIRP